MVMIGAFFAWWYGSGFKQQAAIVDARLTRVSDAFSMPVLLKTLFAPFRQIGTGVRGRSLDDKLRVWADVMVSRIIGAFVRLLTLFAGAVALCVAGLTGVLQMAGWLLLPVAPLAGLIASLLGWLPW